MKKYIERGRALFLVAIEIASFVMSVLVPMIFEDFFNKYGIEVIWVSVIFSCIVITIFILIDYILFLRKEEKTKLKGLQRIERIVSTKMIEEFSAYVTSGAFCQSTLGTMENIEIKNCTLMIRNRGEVETEIYKNEMRITIEKWKEMRRRGKIHRLKIIEYNHMPDSYYVLADDLFVAIGVLDFDENDSTGQFGNRKPYCIFNDDEENSRIIGLYREHFKNYAKKYEDKTIYDSNWD